MSGNRGHGKSAHGGTPVGRRVRVPNGAHEPIKVYINGMEQRRGEDYTMHEREIVFRDPILKEDLRGLSPVRKLVLGLGVIGSYQRNETVDVEYTLNGRREFASNLAVIPDD